jgi:hypothetical protein
MCVGVRGEKQNSTDHLQQRKGETVTKPIELSAKKAEPIGDLPNSTQAEKPLPSKGRKDAAAGQRTEADIMRLNPPRARKASAKPEIVNQIGQCLGRVYNDVLKQPVPDRFIELLQTLETSAPTPLETAGKHPHMSDLADGSGTAKTAVRAKDQK